HPCPSSFPTRPSPPLPLHSFPTRRSSDLPFNYLHVFPFSVRPDAPAAKLREQLPAAVVRDRARELRELGDAKQRAYRASRLGQSADGVVSGHGVGKVELLTQDYPSGYLPIPQWNGCPRCEVTVR